MNQSWLHGTLHSLPPRSLPVSLWEGLFDPLKFSAGPQVRPLQARFGWTGELIYGHGG